MILSISIQDYYDPNNFWEYFGGNDNSGNNNQNAAWADATYKFGPTSDPSNLYNGTLIDYINIVVHVFQKEIRKYYNIESLWGDAKQTKFVSNN